MAIIVVMGMNSYRELKIWDLGQNISLEIYRLTRTFPKEELFGLVSQMRRAAVSISSNVAEGFNRRKPREFQRFLYFSLGSCAEFESQIDISLRLEFLQPSMTKEILDMLNQEGKMLKTFIQKLEPISSHSKLSPPNHALGTKNFELGT